MKEVERGVLPHDQPLAFWVHSVRAQYLGLLLYPQRFYEEGIENFKRID